MTKNHLTKTRAEPSRLSRGGPRTAAGKANSRLNALKHGLTATTLLPFILSAEIIEDHRERLRAEWRPATATQSLLVDEMARHAAALEFAERAEPAVLRTGALAIAGLQANLAFPLGGMADDDVLLTGSVNNDAVDRLMRYRRTHEKGFHQALTRLQELRAKAPVSPPPLVMVEPPFLLNEANCLAYLVRRLQAHRCRRCGHPDGYWLRTRLLWQCANCKHQCGIRVGTVMAQSRLPLTVWFRTIWQILVEPNVSIAQLANVIKIPRAATIRRIAARVRNAQTADNASSLLVGLDLLSYYQRSKQRITTQP